jgi:hypothetical protein
MANLNPDVLAAFRGSPREVTLGKGTRLYRFVTERVNNVVESPWWSDAITFNEIVRLATRTDKRLGDAARARLAVTTEWNPEMSSMCIVALTREAQAWKGVTRHQSLSQQDRSVLLIGGIEQLYVPNLKNSDVALLFYGPSDRL